jgi:hypothetical protein
MKFLLIGRCHKKVAMARSNVHPTMIRFGNTNCAIFVANKGLKPQILLQIIYVMTRILEFEEPGEQRTSSSWTQHESE